MPAGPAFGSGSNALTARMHLANAGGQFFAQHPQPKRKLLLGSADRTGLNLRRESSAHIAKFDGARPGSEEPIKNVGCPSKHVGEYTLVRAVRSLLRTKAGKVFQTPINAL